MTSKTLEQIARDICLAIWDHDYTPRDPLHPDVRWTQAIKAAKPFHGQIARLNAALEKIETTRPHERTLSELTQIARIAREAQ